MVLTFLLGTTVFGVFLFHFFVVLVVFNVCCVLGLFGFCRYCVIHG